MAWQCNCRADTTTEVVLSPKDNAAKLLNAPVSIGDRVRCEGEWAGVN